MEESERLRKPSFMNEKYKIIWITFCMLFACSVAGKKC